MAHVLIVDDEPNMRWVFQEALPKAGHTAYGAADGADALRLLSVSPIDLVVLDLKLKGMDGLATLREIHTRHPQVVVLMLTAYGTVATAVEAMQSGASDYLRKPFDIEEVLFKIARSLERRALQQEIAHLRAAPPAPLPGAHPLWRRACEQAAQSVAQGRDMRLVSENGSGRTWIAQATHAVSARRQAPLVRLDLQTIPAAQQATVLQGSAGQPGLWAAAGQGVLLLRSVGALHHAAAAALGDLCASRAAPQRSTAATHAVGPLLILTGEHDELAPLDAALPSPYTLVHVPPLRDHLDDLLLFAHAWIGARPITPTAIQLLHAYGWPGNLAELRGVLERAAVLAHDNPIEERYLPERVRAAPPADLPIRLPPEGLDLEAVEVGLLKQALAMANGNKAQAARLLGLTRHTLLYRLEKYQIDAI